MVGNNPDNKFSLMISGAFVGLASPVTLVMLAEGAYTMACIGGAIGAAGRAFYSYEHSKDSKNEAIFDDIKYGGALGTGVGTLLTSIPIIVEHPVLIPLSIGTMFIGAYLGYVAETNNHSETSVGVSTSAGLTCELDCVGCFDNQPPQE